MNGSEYKGRIRAGVCAQSYRHLVSLEQQFRSVFDKGHKEKIQACMHIKWFSVSRKSARLRRTGIKPLDSCCIQERKWNLRRADHRPCLPTWKSPVMLPLRSHLYVPGFTTATIQRTWRASDHPPTYPQAPLLGCSSIKGPQEWADCAVQSGMAAEHSEMRYGQHGSECQPCLLGIFFNT